MVRMHAVRVLDRSGKVCTNFDVRDPVSIEVEYWVLQDGYPLNTVIRFTNELGHYLFDSRDNLDSPWRDTIRPTGHYRHICRVPGDFFNHGEITIGFGIETIRNDTFIPHVGRTETVTFLVSDKMDPEGVRGNFSLPWRRDGIRPKLHWTVEKTD